MSVARYVPYHLSPLWERHDAYYFERGLEAWDGDIPWKSTSNYAVARQHAELTLALLGAGRDEVWIHEVGAGACRFAANFLRALERLGDEGRALLGRLRYVVSDHSEKTIGEAAARPPLRPWIERGIVVPALYDARHADPPRALDGKSLSFRAGLVIANYVACVLATAGVERRQGHWRVLHTPATPSSPDGLELAWLRCALEDAFADRFHVELITRYFEERGDGALSYPLGFIDFLRGLGGGGELVMVSDFGTADHHRTPTGKVRPKLYGASLNHAVEFAIFDRFAAAARWSVERVTNGERLLVQALLTRGELAPPAREAFRRVFAQRSDGSDLLDFAAAARALNHAGDFARGARMFTRALKLEPDSALLHFELGQSWTAAGEPARALEILTRGRELDGAAEHDFDFHLGNAHHGCGELERAIACFERSIARAPDAATHCNLAIVHHARGDLARAARALEAALALDPNYQPAQRARDEWKAAWWAGLTSEPC